MKDLPKFDKFRRLEIQHAMHAFFLIKYHTWLFFSQIVFPTVCLFWMSQMNLWKDWKTKSLGGALTYLLSEWMEGLTV